MLVVLCPGLLGAGPADRSWHPDPSGALTPGGTSHSPSMLCTFLLNYFFYYHCFCPCSDGCQCRGGGGEQSRVELFSLPAGLAPASWQGSNFPKVSTFPGTPCREPACAPLWQEGKLPKTHASGPGMDMSSQGTAHCLIPPFCRAGAVHPPPSRGRAVPHAFCDRCAGKGMAASGLSAAAGGAAALTCVGSGSQRPPGVPGTSGCPGPLGEEGSSRGPQASSCL